MAAKKLGKLAGNLWSLGAARFSGYGPLLPSQYLRRPD